MKANEFNTNYYKEEKKKTTTERNLIAPKIKLNNYNIIISTKLKFNALLM